MMRGCFVDVGCCKKWCGVVGFVLTYDEVVEDDVRVSDGSWFIVGVTL